MSREKANHEQQRLEAVANRSLICSCIQVPTGAFNYGLRVFERTF